jgi:hypothetical protein
MSASSVGESKTHRPLICGARSSRCCTPLAPAAGVDQDRRRFGDGCVLLVGADGAAGDRVDVGRGAAGAELLVTVIGGTPTP